MLVPPEEIERVLEDGRPSLHAVVQPGGAVFVRVQRDGRRLPAARRQALDHGDLELVWMLGQRGGARLCMSRVSLLL